MQFTRIIAIILVLVGAARPMFASSVEPCGKHNWSALNRDAQQGNKSLLCQGTADAGLGRRQIAIRLLHRAIQKNPHGAKAYRAHEILLNVYFRAGEYREALVEDDAMLTINAKAKDAANVRPLLVALSRYPDLSISRKRSILPYTSIKDGNPHLPVLVDGKQGIYFMDTGANISVMSDAEAHSLGLTPEPVTTKMGGISGDDDISIRIADVQNLMIGKNHLKHVSFVVLPASHPPFNDIPVNQQAILGLPVLRALRTIRVDKDGQIEAGGRSPANTVGTRMIFDQLTLVLQMSFHGIPLSYTFDTGAVHTTLNPPFAAAFPQTVAKGVRIEHKLTGMGGSTKQSAVKLKSLHFTLWGTGVTLSPAIVLLNKTTGTSAWAAGNLGYDLIKQTAPFTIDFRRMMVFAGQ